MAPRGAGQRTMDAYGTARRRAAIGSESILMGGKQNDGVSKAEKTVSSVAATVKARGLGNGGNGKSTIDSQTTERAVDVDVDAAAPASASSPLGKRRVDPRAKVSPPKKPAVAASRTKAEEGGGGERAAAAAVGGRGARRSLRSLAAGEGEEEQNDEQKETPPPPSAAAPAVDAAAAAAPKMPQKRVSKAAAAVSFAPDVFPGGSGDTAAADDDDGIAGGADNGGERNATPTTRRWSRRRSYLSSWTPPSSSGEQVTFRVGSFAYVVLDNEDDENGENAASTAAAAAASDSAQLDDAADGDACVACGKGHKPLTGFYLERYQQEKEESEKKKKKRAASAGGSDGEGSDDEEEEEDDEEEEEDEEEPSIPVIECSTCLAGYHLDCLDPPLDFVPAAEWLCPRCERGASEEDEAEEKEEETAAAAAATAAAVPAARRSALAPAVPRTLRERFMAGQLGLVRIDSLWREREGGEAGGGGGRGRRKKKKGEGGEEEGRANGGGGEATVRFSGPWLLLPEETHTGRRRGHGAREVFLSSHSCEHDALSLVAAGSGCCSSPSLSPSSPVAVVAEEELASTPGDDVFFCRYEYNSSFRSFRALGAAGAALPGTGGSAAGFGNRGKKKKDKSKRGKGGDDDDSDFDSSDDDDDGDGDDRDFRLSQPDLFDAWARAGHRVQRPATHSKGSVAAGRARRGSGAGGGGGGAPRGRTAQPKQGGGDDDVVRAALFGKATKEGEADEGEGEEEEGDEEDAGDEAEEEEAAAAPRPLSSSSTPSSLSSSSPPSLSALSRARAALAPSAHHCGLPCRDAERARLDAFIRGAAEDGARTSGRCLYVYGVPGTGKTASVLDAVTRALAEAEASSSSSPSPTTKKKSKRSSSSPPATKAAAAGRPTAAATTTAAATARPFRFVEVNALRLPTPRHVYCRLLEAMWGERASPAAAHDLLNARIGAVAPTTAAASARGKAKAKKNGGKAEEKKKTATTKKKKKSDDGDDCASDDEAEDEDEEEEVENTNGNNNNCQDLATIVLVDEMDLLVTRNQAVLYNLFEWPARPNSGIAVIGVANTMDLPDRLLPRIASRFGSARLPFAPYGPAQLREIVDARLRAASGGGSGGGGGKEGKGGAPSSSSSAPSSALEAFEPRAIQYATRKVAAMAGDVRRALELCRMAADVACEEARDEARKKRREEKSKKKKKKGEVDLGDDDDFDDLDFDDSGVVVSMRHVDAAVRAMFGAAHMQALAAAPLLDVVFLAALALELKATGRAAATVADVAPRVAELFAAGGLLPSTTTTQSLPANNNDNPIFSSFAPAPAAPAPAPFAVAASASASAPSLGDVAASAARLAAQRILVSDAVCDARARARVAFDVPLADVLATLRSQRGRTAFVARLPYV